MDLKLYGICFKLRGGPDLLDYIQTNTPVPVEIMGQIMGQLESVSEEELKFAKRLGKDWKKAVGEKVPLRMSIEKGGGYDIECSIPDAMLDTIHTLTGLSNGKIAEEYAADYLKNVCGVDADIIKVDMEEDDAPAKEPQKAEGFSLNDLDDEYEEPEFENLEDLDVDVPAKEPVKQEVPAAAAPLIPDDDYEEAKPMVSPEPAAEMPDDMEKGIPVEEGYPEEEDLPMEEPEFPDDDEMPEELPEEEPEFPDEQEIPDELPDEEPEIPDELDDEPEEESENQRMQAAVASIYKETVKNIRERELDERLGLRIGG